MYKIVSIVLTIVSIIVIYLSLLAVIGHVFGEHVEGVVRDVVNFLSSLYLIYFVIRHTYYTKEGE